MSWLLRASRRRSVAGSLHRSCRPDRAAPRADCCFNVTIDVEHSSYSAGRIAFSALGEQLHHTRDAFGSGRLDQHVDDTVATESEAPNDVVLVSRVVSHDDRRARAHHLLRTVADVALETTATQNASSLAALSDQHSRARTPVRRAFNGDDSRECCELALPECVNNRI